MNNIIKIISNNRENLNFYKKVLLDLEKPKFIFKDIPFFEGFNLLIGDSGIGKTNLAINIALYRASQNNRVLYWTSDSSMKLILSRMQNLYQQYYLDKEDIILNNIDIVHKDQYSNMKLLFEYADLYYDCIVIDSSSSIFFENAHNEYEQQLMYSLLMETFNSSKCTFISLHELNKTGDIKGNNTQIYKANNAYNLTQSGNNVEISSRKDRYGYPVSKLKFNDFYNMNKVIEKKKKIKDNIEPNYVSLSEWK